MAKPIQGKAYGSIPHVQGSRMGPSDIGLTPGQSAICTVKRRDKADKIIVQEKLDGACVAVAKIDGELVPLTRSGNLAQFSRFEHHVLFHEWATENSIRFYSILNEGERAVGEWLAMAHGTLYDIDNAPGSWNTGMEPFVVFDIFTIDNKRLCYVEMVERILALPKSEWFQIPQTVGFGLPMPPEQAMEAIDTRIHGASELEGVVYRVERYGEVEFLAKYVKPDKIDGCYLPSVTGQPPIWNWQSSRKAQGHVPNEMGEVY